MSTPHGQPMQTGSADSSTKGRAIISADSVFEGKISQAEVVEVHGEVRGEIGTAHLVVHQGGRVFGSAHAKTAEVFGQAEGELVVSDRCAIMSTGSVSGDVRYGRLSLEEGGNLEAHLRNIPPELGGDFEMVVRRGGTAQITTSDLTAFDPDNTADELKFQVSTPAGGHVAQRDDVTTPVTSFTQAELQAGVIVFVSDPAAAGDARFDVTVTDAAGGTSGAPKTVQIKVQDAA